MPRSAAIVSSGKNLFVRVKRKRDEEVCEAIQCVVSAGHQHHQPTSSTAAGGGGGAGRLQRLTLGDEGAPVLKRVLLSRVLTLEGGDGRGDLELVTAAVTAAAAASVERPPRNKRALEEAAYSANETASSSAKIPSRSVYLLSERRDLGASILVDVTQIKGQQLLEHTPAHADVSGAVSGAGTTVSAKIYDPITKQLGPAIHKAFLTGKLADLSALLSLERHQQHQGKGEGVDVNYTNEALEGRTALMAAARYPSRALVSQLLARGAHVLQADSRGRTALDYAAEHRRQQTQAGGGEAEEVALALHSAAAAALLASHAPTDDQDFVFDIYTQQSHAEDAASSGGDGLVAEEAAAPAFDGPYVPLPGVCFGADGGCELVFEYSEDWSDLGADDEDVDSNDERWHGNDYPEEEEGDEVGDRGGGGYEDSMDSDEEPDPLPRFERRGVGRVFLPFARDDPTLPVNMQPGGVQRLWGEPADDDDDDNADHNGDDSYDDGRRRLRLRGMQQASGMRFGADASQFDGRGLAKYGAELSDDEPDEQLLLGAAYTHSYARGGLDPHSAGHRPARDTVAFDSDLDCSDDDD